MLVECSKNGVCNVGGMFVENYPESHKPVEIGDLRAPSDSGSGEAPEVQTVPTKPPGEILAPGKSYSTRHGGSDDGGMAGTEGKRINTNGWTR